MINYLLENKGDLNFVDKFNSPSLHNALLNENISLEIVKYLVENKADLTLKDNDGNIPIYYALQNENISIEIVKYLVESMLDILIHNKIIKLLLFSYFNRKA